MPYPSDLVLKVNEVFHDVEGSAYAKAHPEIFDGEVRRWDDIARNEIAPLRRPIRILDIGCGTGFVASRLAPVLSADDTIVCADLSQSMLDACRIAISTAGHQCQFEFSKLDGATLGERSSSCDVVTMNSVLHHLPDPGKALREIARVLKPGGAFIVAHEPNRRFYASRIFRVRAALVGAIVSPRRTAGGVLRRAGLMSFVHRLGRRSRYGQILSEVNRSLIEAGTIKRPFTQDELTAIVDVQSPTAGGWHPDRGIDIALLARQHMPDFDCRLTTYDHLGSGTQRATGWIAAYSKRLAKRRPDYGATLLAVLIKGPPHSGQSSKALP